MQATEADSDQQKNGGNEEAINFRPSPNFKHMKKYRKSKLEEAVFNSSSSGDQTSCSSAEEEERSNPPSVMVQPPLPPNPPPPDSPLQVTFKREIEDDDYQSPNEENKNQSKEESEYRPGTSEKTEDKSKIMCRQFVRGICTRGATCIYRHELILDQLPGVYTFCKNFQNNGCKFPKCKFVHATVFEKEYFYRTGFLHPHTLAHLKENTTQVQAPPLPAVEVSGTVEVPTAFPNPPPPMYPNMLRPLGTLPGTGASTATASGAAVAAERKRDWPGIFEFGASTSASATATATAAASSSSTSHDLLEPPPIKCRECDITELRYKCNKNKVEQLLLSTQERKAKLDALTRKNNLLYTIIGTQMKVSPEKTPLAALLNDVTVKNDKEKAIIDQLKMCLSANRHPVAAEDKNINISTVLLRLLLSTGEGGSSA